MIEIDQIKLNGGIHTMEVEFINPTNPNYSHAGIQSIKSSRAKKINPNNYAGYATKYIDSYSEFVAAFEDCVKNFGAESYIIRRVDFRIDDYFHTFEELIRYNAAVLLSMTLQNNLSQVERYARTTIHNKRFTDGIQIHCYDRIEKEGCSIAKTRFEIKVQGLNLTDIRQISGIGRYWADQVERCADIYREKQDVFADWVSKRITKDFLGCSFRKPSYAQKFDEYRWMILTAKQFRRICRILNLNDQTCDKYAGAGRLGLNREWVTETAMEQYSSKAANALRYFFTL